jgi:hypothetical protein
LEVEEAQQIEKLRMTQAQQEEAFMKLKQAIEL